MSKQNETRMSTKIYLVLGILTLVAVVVAFLGVLRMGQINDSLNAIVDGSAEKVKLAARINQGILFIHRAEKNMVLATSEEDMKQYAQAIEEMKKDMEGRLSKLRELSDATARAKLDQFSASWNEFLKANEKVREYAMLNSNVEAKDMSMNQGREAFDRAEKALENIVNMDQQLARAAEMAATDDRAKAMVSLNLTKEMLALHRAEKNLILETTEEGMAEYVKIIETSKAEINKLIGQFEQAIGTAERAGFLEFKNAWNNFL